MMRTGHPDHIAARRVLWAVLLAAAAGCAASTTRGAPLDLTYPHPGFGRVGCFAGPGLGNHVSTIATSVDSAAASGPWLVLDSISISEWKRHYAPRQPWNPTLRTWKLIIRLDSLEGATVVASRLINFGTEWRRAANDSVAFDDRGSLAPTDWRFAISPTNIQGVATMGHDFGTVSASGKYQGHTSSWSTFGLRVPCSSVPIVAPYVWWSVPTPVDRSVVLAALGRLESPIDSVRIQAFEQMLGLPPRDSQYAGEATAALLRDHARDRQRIGAALIALLERENVVASAPPHVDTHLTPYTYHYDRVITSVALLYDPAAIPALIGSLNRGLSAVAGLSALGPRTLPSLVQSMSAPNRLVRWGALLTMKRLLGRTAEFTLGPADLALIRATANSALTDADESVRYEARQVLAALAEQR